MLQALSVCPCCSVFSHASLREIGAKNVLLNFQKKKKIEDSSLVFFGIRGDYPQGQKLDFYISKKKNMFLLLVPIIFYFVARPHKILDYQVIYYKN